MASRYDENPPCGGYSQNPMSRGCSEASIQKNIAMEYKRLRKERPRAVPDQDISRQAFAIAMNHARKMGCKRPMGYRKNPATIAKDLYDLMRSGAVVAAFQELGAVFVADGRTMTLWLETPDGYFIEEERRRLHGPEAQWTYDGLTGMANEWHEELRREFGWEEQPAHEG